MNNVEFSKIGRAIANNSALSRYITHRLSHLTPEEKKRGYFEIQLKEDKKLKLTFGPDRRSKEERKKLQSKLQHA
jgi:hypothetical protein